LECIGCAACIDACDTIMTKLKRPKGLVRYDSMQGLQGKKTRWIRPRILAYTVLMLVGMTALGLSLKRLHSFQPTLTRMVGSPYYVGETSVRNQFQLELVNKRQSSEEFHLVLKGAPAGTIMSGASESVTLAPTQELKTILIIEIPKSSYQGKQKLELNVQSLTHPDSVVIEFDFTGPDPRLLQETPTH
jgi:polyferredoxin